MDAKTNGALPAHPIPIAGCNDGAVYNSLEQSSGLYGGLTKREMFAAMAMQGVMAMQSHPDVIEAVAACAQEAGKTTDDYIASNCVSLADALLVALATESAP